MTSPVLMHQKSPSFLTHTAETAKIIVGFTFYNDGSDWPGGFNYFRSLFTALHALPACALHPIAFVGKKAAITKLGFPENIQIVRDSVFDRLSLRWSINKLSAVLFGRPWISNSVFRRHGIEALSHSLQPCDRRIKKIIWIPDFQHMHLPKFFKPEELETRNRQYLGALKQCDVVVVSSHAALQDLQNFAPAYAAKARVLQFCATLPSTGQKYQVVDVAATYALGKRFFYMPNQAWAHKNHLTVIRALAELADEHPDVKIVCSGSLSDYRNPTHLEHLRSEIAKHKLTERFLMLGLLPYEHIAQLMERCVAVINPSLFEGWSTTVEEAKALGVPLVLSDIDVHREQCTHGEAIFFSALDAAALAAALRAKLETQQTSGESIRLNAKDKHRRNAEIFARNYEGIVVEVCRDSNISRSDAQAG